MPSIAFDTKRISNAPDAMAPDGSEVRALCGLPRASLAVFSLPPNAVAKAVAHHTVDEIWYVVAGEGRLWRKLGEQEETVDLGPGVSITIPVGTQFQFRCEGVETLTIIGATIPPWPGDGEAYAVSGRWPPTV